MAVSMVPPWCGEAMVGAHPAARTRRMSRAMSRLRGISGKTGGTGVPSGGRRPVPRFAGLHDRLGAGLHAQLGEDAGHHVAHRLLAQFQVRRGLVVVEAASEVFEHLALACRELGERLAAALARQEGIDLLDEMREGRLTFQQYVVAAFERNEARARD